MSLRVAGVELHTLTTSTIYKYIQNMRGGNGGKGKSEGFKAVMCRLMPPGIGEEIVASEDIGYSAAYYAAQAVHHGADEDRVKRIALLML